MANPEKTMENCILMLQHIQEDSTIPRNIRRVADETRTLLSNNTKAMGLRAAEAISKIDEISNDPNMPHPCSDTDLGAGFPARNDPARLGLNGFF